MLKVTFSVLGLFSLKNYNDGHMSSRSYPYATTSTIRGAILSAMIRRKGKEYAKDHFYNLKHVQIFVQHPEHYQTNQTKVRLLSNKSMGLKAQEKIITNLENVNSVLSVGIREQIAVEEIVFYIDETLENTVEYLDNIQRIGNSESLVELKSIERVSRLENVLMPWNPSFGYDYELKEDWDWETKITKKENDKGLAFENIYLFSKKLANKNRKTICFVKDIVDFS